jgi:hypothetical protein
MMEEDIRRADALKAFSETLKMDLAAWMDAAEIMSKFSWDKVKLSDEEHLDLFARLTHVYFNGAGNLVPALLAAIADCNRLRAVDLTLGPRAEEMRKLLEGLVRKLPETRDAANMFFPVLFEKIKRLLPDKDGRAPSGDSPDGQDTLN